jgi:predicted dehydrogenase
MSVTRREFTRTSVALGVAGALGSMRVLGANERIRLGVIGCGGRGGPMWRTFLAQPEVDAVAVCDAYAPFRDKAAIVDGRTLPAYADFRELLDRHDVDAVLVATPDHWHAYMTIAAVKAGKDVYVEKPLSLVVREGRLMVEAARAHARIVAVGSQQRSGAHYAEAVQRIRDGAIGSVHHVHAGMTRNAMPGFVATELRTGPADALDWDRFVGPSPLVPFDPFKGIYHFRWFWQFSGGQMTNWGAHHLDIARWAIGAAAPTAVAGFGGRYAIEDGGETPDVQQVLYDFPGCVVSWSTREVNRGDGAGLAFYGTKGTLDLRRNGYTIRPETWTGQDPADLGRKWEPAAEAVEVKGGDLDRQHVRNFLECVKSRARPNADVEEGHRTAVLCHLGNIATRLGRSLKWDATREQVIGDEEANRLLTRQYRAPWRLEGL